MRTFQSKVLFLVKELLGGPFRPALSSIMCINFLDLLGILTTCFTIELDMDLCLLVYGFFICIGPGSSSFCVPCQSTMQPLHWILVN